MIKKHTEINLNATLQPILNICTALGIISFKVNAKITTSRRSKIVILIAMISFLSLTMFVLIKRTAQMENHDLILQLIHDLSHIILPSILLYTIWTQSIIRQKEHIILLKDFTQLDEEIKKLGLYIYYPKTKHRLYGILVLWLILNIITIYMTLQNSLINFLEFSNVVVLFINVIPVYISEIVVVLIHAYTTIILQRFKIINEFIWDLRNSNISQDAKGKDYSLRLKAISPMRSKLSNLRLMMSLHLDCNRQMVKLTDLFGVVMVFILSVNFFGMLMTAFGLCWQIKHEIYERFTVVMFQFLSYMIGTFFLCTSCHAPVKEAKRTGVLLHLVDYDDDEIKYELEMFSLQIANEVSQITGSDLFNIDYGLLFAMAGGITTYLVILIQFQD